MNLRFAHLADLHLGGWREKTMTQLNMEAFQSAIDKVIENNVDFCIFAGDIFNSPIPPLDIVNKVVHELKKLKEAEIPLYVIGGSHDYSATGKSFIELLDSAGIFIDVGKWKYTDKNRVELEWTWHNNEVLLSGIIGKRNGLEKVYYDNISRQDLPQNAYKIFLFHTTLNDLKPSFMDNVKTEVTSEYLPKGFDYYAGGHVHTYLDGEYSGGRVTYPGPLFPNSIAELKRERPSFNLCNFDGEKTFVERVEVKNYEFDTIYLECNHEMPHTIRERLSAIIEKKEVAGKIVLVEIRGIVDGRVADIGLIDTTKQIYVKGALQVLKHTYNLTSSQLEESTNIDTQISPQEIEELVINEMLEYENYKEYKKQSMKSLLTLDLEKQEEERNAQYEERAKTSVEKCL